MNEASKITPSATGRKSFMADMPKLPISRRSLLVGGGASVGLLLAWGIWPRTYEPNLVAGQDETIYNEFLKIGADGQIVVVVPQPELGQGIYTSLSQILADELGADWRTVSVEPAPISPLYANELIFAESKEELPKWLQGPGEWAFRQLGIRMSAMLIGGSTSIRGFEQRYREAGATARALLCMAAGKRWGADWQACDTADGFVIRGDDKIRFGELAAEAAKLTPPSDIPLRKPGAGGISGKSVPRLDLPSKVDGTARYGADIRLPGMVYASVRHGPFGDTTLMEVDKAAADKIDGVIAIVENPRWVAAIATNWWAADRALDALSPKFRTTGGFPDDASMSASLENALNGGPSKRFFERGDPDEVLKGGQPFSAEYRVPLAPHAPMETLNATARLTGDRLELWLPTQALAFTRDAAARAVNMPPESVTAYQTLVGGSFGRKGSIDAAEIAAILAVKTKRPVQLIFSRAEETMRDEFRQPAIGRMSAKLGENGRPLVWAAAISAPSTIAERFAATMPNMPGADPSKPELRAIEGGIPPYNIPAIAMDHHVAPLGGVTTGAWRGVANSYNAFFLECFIDELAEEAGIEPFSYRMQLLGGAPRLARCLTTVATLGNWQGGIAGSGQGIAAHSCYGSHVATLAELHVDQGQIKLDKIVMAIDCGRMIHPDIVRQQIEGGIVYGISGALGHAISVERGLVTARNFSGLGLPMLTDIPEIVVELIENDEPPSGVGEIAVPSVPPAIANALFTATGQRSRTLPLRTA
jgi:isoquinoline 1-oxidoreductase beta subunit